MAKVSEIVGTPQHHVKMKSYGPPKTPQMLLRIKETTVPYLCEFFQTISYLLKDVHFEEMKSSSMRAMYLH
jgi:hypothetical protein